jgi:hypothetical protein
MNSVFKILVLDHLSFSFDVEENLDSLSYFQVITKKIFQVMF